MYSAHFYDHKKRRSKLNYVCSQGNSAPRPDTHCSKVKMNGKKLSKFQFHFPGLLGTSQMSKQETKKIYNWTSEIIPFIHMGKQMDGT